MVKKWWCKWTTCNLTIEVECNGVTDPMAGIYEMADGEFIDITAFPDLINIGYLDISSNEINDIIFSG